MIRALLTLAILPSYLLLVGYYFLEISQRNSIDLDTGFVWRVIVLLIIFIATHRTTNILFPILFDKKNSIKIKKNSYIVNVSIIASFVYILYSFISYHYVTPSGSVQYYLAYDYSRLLNSTGHYRPNLPLENPSGTWLSMLTYNPSFAASAALLWPSSNLGEFRHVIGFLGGLLNIGSISFIGLLSYKLSKSFIPGIIIGLSIFYYFVKSEGLAQSLAIIGPHDFPIFYYFSFGIFMFFCIYKTFKRTSSLDSIIISIFTFSVLFNGFSIRPYLLNMFITSILLLAISIYKDRKILATDKNYLIRNQLNYFSLINVFIASDWFLQLWQKYKVFVVYSHSKQFENVSGYKSSIQSIIKTLIDVLLNYDGDRIFFSIGHFVVFIICFTSLLVGFYKGKKQFTNTKILLSLAFFLFIIPIFTFTGVHWKSYSAFIYCIYLILPLTCFIDFKVIRLLNSRRIKIISISLLFLVLVYAPQALPDKKFNTQLKNDEIFRNKVSKIYDQYGGKILVLRGGEPGGDIQSNIKELFYWDNFFLFGDYDQKLLNQKISSEELFCNFKRDNINLIFNPSTLEEHIIDNHSSEEIMRELTEMMSQEPDKFVKVLIRNDPYKGALYKINYQELIGCENNENI